MVAQLTAAAELRTARSWQLWIAEDVMKHIGIACGLALVCAVGVGAQKTETTTESKVTVKGGKDVTVTGCVERLVGRPGFMLSHVADKSGALHNYELVGDTDEVAKHMGDRLQVKGKAADRGDAKIETETTTKVDVEHGKDRETQTKAKAEGSLPGATYLRVESVKMIAAACP